MERGVVNAHNYMSRSKRKQDEDVRFNALFNVLSARNTAGFAGIIVCPSQRHILMAMKRMLRLAAASAATALVLGLAALPFTPPAQSVGEPTFTNALFTEADPTVEYYNGNYYAAATTWSGVVTMRKAPTLANLKTAVPVVVYSDTATGRSSNMWAPELQRLQGPNGWRWYLMYTMGTPANLDNQHLHVLESSGDDPLGPYSYKGQPVPTTAWNIDGAYLQLNGELFAVWSQFAPAPDGRQSNYIARMSNPWTVSGPAQILSQPTLSWETEGGAVNEGPIPLQRDGKTFIVYSASGCWTPDYKLGMLTYNGGDPVLAASWTKGADPVFSKANGVFGPGHNDFFTSPDGTQVWNAYHGNNSSGDGCGKTRSTRAQPVSWSAGGSPLLGQPVSTSTEVNVPSGERGPITTPVNGAAYELVNRNSGLCATVSGGSGADGAGLVQTACTGTPASSWKLDSTADGYYRLVGASSNKSLDAANCGTANGTQVRQWSWLANACQEWRPAPAADGYSSLTNRNSGKVLDAAGCSVASGSKVQLWTSLGNACQQWALRPVGNVGIVSAASGKSFDIPGCSTASGASLQQWEWSGSPCQRWSFSSAASGYVQIHPQSAPSLCLGVSASSTADGAGVAQTACTENGTRWRIDHRQDGTINFVAAHSGKLLDLAGCGLANGTRINQWSNLNNTCQQFRVTP